VTRRVRPALARAIVVLLLGPPCASAQGLTGEPQLLRAYAAIFDARFGEMPQIVRGTCPPAPAEACQLLDAVSLWWQIQLDPLSKARDAQFQSKVDASIAATEAWAKREPRRAEAWFYVGGAYGARAQWRVLRGERLGAARDGKQIKESLEKALALDPSLQEAYFGIGLYHYYADVAPAAAKVLRWLLWLPGGNKVQGMQEMLRARDNSEVLRDEGDYQLHIIYLWYEKQPQRALDLLEGLRRRHPRNPLFEQLIAEVQDTYLHDSTASLRSWQALLEDARARRVAFQELAETKARLGAALELDRLFETDAAIEHLRIVIAAKPSAPFGAVAQAQRQLTQALDRTSDPAYRLSIEGLRALERGDLAGAARALTQSLALKPGDPVTRYRHAQLLLAEKKDTEALVELEAVIKTRATTAPTVYASACVDAARLYERQRSPARAIELYRIARGVFGADQRTKDAADRALARLAL
jgi:tetratricopeptide (TPR) repeat protein